MVHWYAVGAVDAFSTSPTQGRLTMLWAAQLNACMANIPSENWV
jgi:hypothetical protein